MGNLRLVAVTGVIFGTLAAAAQTGGLPAMPTTSAQQAPLSAGASAVTSSNEPQRHRPVVIVTPERLEIRANNSSLNGILREVAAQTGMTISGGVLDQRVFGTYGPGSTEEVLSELLQDTGTNMILRLTSAGEPLELTLSPRMGGPSPPSPSAFRNEEDRAPAYEAARPDAAGAGAEPKQQLPQLPFSKPAAEPSAAGPMRTPITPDAGGFVSAPTVAPATEPGTTPGPSTQTTGTSDPNSGSSNGAGGVPQSPNGVRTPQQIYEQLQKLMQQQQKPPTSQ